MSSVISAIPQLSAASVSAGRISPLVATAMLDGISDLALWQKSGRTTGGAARPTPSVPSPRRSIMAWSAGAASLSNTVNWRSPASREPVRTSISISSLSCRETGERLAHTVHVGIGQAREHRQRQQPRENLVRGRQLAARLQAEQVAEVRQVMNRDEVHRGADIGLGQPLGRRITVYSERPGMNAHDVQVPGMGIRRWARRKLEALEAGQLCVVPRGDGRPALLPGRQAAQLLPADGGLQVGEVR